jgi:hypothetical protein
MRVLITASGIQDYIFAINAQAAGARLRGRSARLGFAVDYCLVCLRERYPEQFEVVRSAGSRLEVEFHQEPRELRAFLDQLQGRLDTFSRDQLRGQVWFTVAWGEGAEPIHHALARRKLAQGRALLQNAAGQHTVNWNEHSFLLPPEEERSLSKEQARDLPESRLGLELVRPHRRYLWFSRQSSSEPQPVKIVDAVVRISDAPPAGTPAWALDADTPNIPRKHLARHAPRCDNDMRLCDLEEIAEESSGADFLGVLKADLDNLGATFGAFPQSEQGKKEAQELSDKLETLFTQDLDGMLESRSPYCYVVYSGGDDLFLLGPWDQLLRFVHAFRERLQRSAEAWGHRELTLSAGFRLAHPKSPLRHLARDVEDALDWAKGKVSVPSPLPPKNRVCAFERVLAWEDLRSGLQYADRFITGVKDGLSVGFLRRLQYYGSEFRRFEGGCIDGLRMLPLLENDWYRNTSHLKASLRSELEGAHRLLVRPNDEGASAWRQIDFATHFALYAVRGKEGSSDGR